jgi:hypothetical protein
MGGGPEFSSPVSPSFQHDLFRANPLKGDMRMRTFHRIKVPTIRPLKEQFIL